jgi:hypothetical protein
MTCCNTRWDGRHYQVMLDKVIGKVERQVKKRRYHPAVLEVDL